MVRNQIVPAALAAICMLALAACGSTHKVVSAPIKTAKVAATKAASKPTPTVPAFDPTPKGTARTSCDYLLGDSDGNSGYKFTVDAVLKNTGDVGIVAELKATWRLSGGGKVTKTEDERVKAGKTKNVSFSVPSTVDQILSYQQIDESLGNACSVKVSIVDSF